MSHSKGKKRVGVLRGGPSGEYEVSLKTGNTVLAHLPPHYEPIDILIDKKGVWHVGGLPKSPESVLRLVDVVFNALHGDYGEDGKVQQLLDAFGVPYTGSGAVASALSMNKYLTKKVYIARGLRTPHFEILRREDIERPKLFGVFANLNKPLVVKPASAGSSLGVTILVDWEEFTPAVEHALEFSDTVLVEEFVKGIEATCGVLDSATTKGEIYALPPVEIVKPEESPFFNYDAKYSGASQEFCPGRFNPHQTKKIQEMAKEAHRALGLRHYSRSDFIVADDDIYILETNTLPGLTQESLLPKSLLAADCSLPDFLDHVIILAIEGD